ncbi:MAG: hypothetical protein M1587_12000, partial [Thaumarchaeota archaeon]|nr:hypothetical protein [Nitrososphaerota archaeon]
MWRRDNQRVDTEYLLRYLLYGFLLLLVFYPLYKYYLVGIIPILVLLVRNKKDAVAFLVFSLVFMLVPRYLSSWVLLITLIWLLRA